MTPMQQRLLAMSAAMHRIPASSVWLASLYLRIFRVLKYLPDGRWKRAIERTVEEVQRPEVSLPSSRSELAPGFAARIVPHVGEFDFSAHLYRRMPYEREVCS